VRLERLAEPALSKQVVKMIPSSLVGHVSHKIKSALSSRGWVSAEVDAVAQSLVKQLLSDPKIGTSKKLTFETGERLSRALVTPHAACSTYSTLLTADFKSLLQSYEHHLEVNQALFEDIEGHHANITNEDWSTVANDNSSLAVYADAANAMGTKRWVAECNRWFETFSIAYFREGGARKYYLRSLAAGERASQTDKTVADSITKDLMADGSGSSKIRLLDVGSCYNPLAKCARADQFEVTALDLYPVDPTVLQCDFLNLEVGFEGTDPVVVDQSRVRADGAICGDKNSGCDSEPASKRAKLQDDRPVPDSETNQAGDSSCTSTKQLLRLPAASYDVVTMSLVLNYLPTPEQRLRMIHQARAVLVSPPAPQDTADGAKFVQPPHRNGLLLIAEKNSIFKPPFKQRQKGAQNAKGTTVGTSKAEPNEPVTRSPTRADSADGTFPATVVGGASNNAVKPDDWTNWVQCITSCGFELVKYHYLPSGDGRKSHLFAFCTVPLPAQTRDATAAGPVGPKMWIKQDRERAKLHA
jgi:2-polyprenyl-3-methyl-5-hydroxy-6-metoxy-1,4-benzoquinol methylase